MIQEVAVMKVSTHPMTYDVAVDFLISSQVSFSVNYSSSLLVACLNFSLYSDIMDLPQGSMSGFMLSLAAFVAYRVVGEKSILKVTMKCYDWRSFGQQRVLLGTKSFIRAKLMA